MAHSLAAVASVSPSAVRRRLSSQVTNVISSLSSVSFRSQMSFMSIRSRPSLLRSTICCSAKEETVQAKTVQAKKETVDKAKEETVQAKTVQAKKETVDKVCDIVKKQLALSEGTAVMAESKFSELGADSLDTVEIVMGLEEEFNITVDETSAQDIATVQDAADLIEKLVLEKTA